MNRQRNIEDLAMVVAEAREGGFGVRQEVIRMLLWEKVAHEAR